MAQFTIERLDPVATWDDLVLPPEEVILLRRVAARVAQRIRVDDHWGFRQRMNRGSGITALFAGESGTGKTMAAEVIANHLDLHLYRIDLSAVVSKYIGETEKNLRRVFDAAEDGGAILLFDEADALFGKRSDVRDSHDRYANIETNHLLQRMEAHRGLAILATNNRTALDDAFVRRLRFIITFPFPNREQRRSIWERSWPAATTLDRMDYDRLARLDLAGGNIASVALAASFLAAERGTAVTMPIVLEAARAEYHKLERPVNEVAFTWDGSASTG
jgi:SpoVK/Ycf46/Vps4 family AAA+-type ATPase